MQRNVEWPQFICKKIDISRGLKDLKPLGGVIPLSRRESCRIPERALVASRSTLPKNLARPEGLEPPTYWFEASRSIQLS